MSPTSQFVAPPDPGRATTLDELADALRRLKAWAGNPSYETIATRVNAARPATDQVGKTTVVDCFRAGRRRLDGDLVVAVVEALHPDLGYVTQWRQALRVISGETEAAAQVRVRDSLPPDPAGFVGRAAELELIRRGAHGTLVLTGMAGVGKTQLAVHVGHLLGPFDRVLFVNLRGFHHDEAQPPADPAAVLDAFLRLLGMPGSQVPHGVAARSAAFRERLAGSRTLVILDDAADAGQVGPLLPTDPGGVTLVTSRRRLEGLPTVPVGVFTEAEALDYLAAEVPGIPAGDDAEAAARIARRCGHLPLALALVAGHLRAKPGWTLTDHADRLDERPLDAGVELALDVSYRNLPPTARALLRLLALHPGQDFDAFAAAALAAGDPAGDLAVLAAHHLIQPAAPGRYALHDLVRAFAAARSADEDRRTDRLAARERLVDYYLAVAARAMNAIDPVEAARRPSVPDPATPLPDLTSPVSWLDTERPNLVAMAGYGLARQTVALSLIVFRYLVGGHHTEALTVHGAAIRAAREIEDPPAHARALAYQAMAEVQLGRHEQAVLHLEQSLALTRRLGDDLAVARTANNLGIAETRLGRYADAAAHHEEALRLYRAGGEEVGAARALINLGNLSARRGDPAAAATQYEEAVGFSSAAGDGMGESAALVNLAEVEATLGRHEAASEHVQRALSLARSLGIVSTEAWALDALGTVQRARGRFAEAADSHQQALTLFLRTGDRDGEAWARNGLGEDAMALGTFAEAAKQHAAAHDIAVEAGDVEQQARAQQGLGAAYRMLDEPDRARECYEHARRLWTQLGSPEAERIVEELGRL